MKTRFIVFKLQIAHNNIKTVFLPLRLIIHEETFPRSFAFLASFESENEAKVLFGFYVFVPNVFISISIFHLHYGCGSSSQQSYFIRKIADGGRTEIRLRNIFYGFCKANNNEFHCFMVLLLFEPTNFSLPSHTTR